MLLLAATSGCASTKAHARPDLLAFLAPGTTTRADVILRLGEPSRTYEDDRILTYRVDKDDGGYVVVDRARMWTDVRYTLVLLFDGQGVLQNHSLVAARPPS